MGLNDTPSGERVHVAFFGVRNAGKSSLVNAVTGQDLSIVSDVGGTTTDPVRKAMELLPLGPVLIIDTPGLDDEGALGALRVERTLRILAETDAAVLAADARRPLSEHDHRLLALLKERAVPFLIARTKADLLRPEERPAPGRDELCVSAVTGENVEELKERIAALARSVEDKKRLIADLLSPGDTVLLIMPQDGSAPKGRLILPQQQTVREVLDAHAIVVACQETEVAEALSGLTRPPRLAVTDSKVFARAAQDVPPCVPLTSFSILFARYKGNLTALARGAGRLSRLRTGDRVLIAEGCTHHRQCGDIGAVLMPGWIERYAGARPCFDFASGGDFPRDLSGVSLVLHCGGCMLNEREMQRRIGEAEAAGAPIVNYGMAIAQMHGVLRRSLELFPDVLRLMEEERAR